MIVAPSMLRNVGRARTCGETTTDRGRRSLRQERPRHGAARAERRPATGQGSRRGARRPRSATPSSAAARIATATTAGQKAGSAPARATRS